MDSVQTRTKILDEDGVKRKIKRMALEIAEQNAGEAGIILAGIVGNGETVARSVAAELRILSTMETTVVTVQLNKRDVNEVRLEPGIALENKIIVIADDVANTGKTMLYALKPFLNSSPKKIQTLALVERSHKLFPVQTDYAGLTIATTLQEHIAVETEGEKITGAWLY
jgi:pyrimidine operon attenuation protein/uracil phosphoribosyltransferase